MDDPATFMEMVDYMYNRRFSDSDEEDMSDDSDDSRVMDSASPIFLDQNFLDYIFFYSKFQHSLHTQMMCSIRAIRQLLWSLMFSMYMTKPRNY